ncbi:hypothetical protein [Novosphingobium aquae]|uniref:Uncharacterized protein n=1 Tax=Novosphingobium aquae TaxID=3133435 RepID=A0ABU8SBU5_9SPHN
MEFTKEIETPIGKHKVVFKTMVTGAEREQIDAAQMEFVQTTDGKEFKVTDMKKVATASKHALLKISVLSIDGDEIECFARLQKMYEPDYAFVCDEIERTQKKMKASTSPAS